MIELADPRDDALDAHAESAVRDGPVSTEIEVPLERFLRQIVLLDALQQQIQVRETLASADDLAIPLGREHVDAERHLWPLRIRFHVKRLHCRRVPVNHDRPIEVLRQGRLVGPAEIAAPLEREPFLLQNLYRLIVREAWKGRLDALELADVALEDRELAPPLLEHALDDRRH